MRERQEALAKFRESLSRPLTERFYEEDELIDYFDFASDFNDDYLRMEALICAARFYPNSEELLQRKAIFYSQYSDEVMDKCVEDHPKSTGVIWDVMRAKNACIESAQEQIDTLDTILASYDQFTDEEIIQFVGLATSYEQLQWLKDHVEILRKKAIFPAVLLYEVASAAEMSDDTDYAIQLLEELTELEPFNPDFWVVLSKEYVQIQQFEKGLSALEYAIAIDPENADTLSLKAKLLFMMGGDKDEIITLTKRIEELDGMNREMLRLVGVIYQSIGENPRAIEIYERFIHRHPEQSNDILLDMIPFAPEDTDVILDRIYSINKNLNDWLSWAEEYEFMGATSVAAALLNTFCRNAHVFDPPFAMVELSFRLGLFELTNLLLSYYLRHGDNPIQNTTKKQNMEGGDKNNLVFYTILLITKLKLGKMSDVAMLAHEIKRHDFSSTIPNVKDRLTILGFSKIIDNIIGVFYQHGTNYSWDTFDPFGFWNDGQGTSESDEKSSDQKKII